MEIKINNLYNKYTLKEAVDLGRNSDNSNSDDVDRVVVSVVLKNRLSVAYVFLSSDESNENERRKGIHINKTIRLVAYISSNMGPSRGLFLEEDDLKAFCKQIYERDDFPELMLNNGLFACAVRDIALGVDFSTF